MNFQRNGKTARVIGSASNTEAVHSVSFKHQMEDNSKSKHSSIVLALDFPYQSTLEREQLLTKAKNLWIGLAPIFARLNLTITSRCHLTFLAASKPS